MTVGPLFLFWCVVGLKIADFNVETGHRPVSTPQFGVEHTGLIILLSVYEVKTPAFQVGRILISPLALFCF